MGRDSNKKHTYDVLVEFRRGAELFEVGDNYEADEVWAWPLLMKGLIAEKEAEAPHVKPKPKAKRRGL